MTPLHVVAVGAHPDDIELSMGGLCLRYAQAGHHVSWIVATDGAAGSGGRDVNLAKLRSTEATQAAGQANATLVELGFPDGQLGWCAEAPAALGQQLATLAPSLIITHAINDYHADHRAVARIVGDTAPMGVPILRADTMLGLHFAPEILVDISAVFAAKIAILAKHASQATLALPDALTVWSRFRGLQSGGRRFAHAEAYAFDRRLGAEVLPLLDRVGGYTLL